MAPAKKKLLLPDVDGAATEAQKPAKRGRKAAVAPVAVPEGEPATEVQKPAAEVQKLAANRVRKGAVGAVGASASTLSADTAMANFFQARCVGPRSHMP